MYVFCYHISGELNLCVLVNQCSAPVVKVADVQSLVVESRAVELTWSQLSCYDRRGVEPRYDVLVANSQHAIRVNTSSPPCWVYTLRPYTQYTVRVRYSNEYGTAPYSDSLRLTTQADGTTYVRPLNDVHAAINNYSLLSLAAFFI